MARRCARFIRAIEGFRLAGIYDVDDDMTRAVTAVLSGVAFPDFDVLVRTPELAGVVITTPQDRHLEWAST